MNETQEIERCREIEAELRGLASRARTYGTISTGLLVASALFAWVPGEAEPSKFAWSCLCGGLLIGIHWAIFVVEANRAKLELSLHLAKCQVLAQSQVLARGVDSGG